jgi:hypothetical protein
VVEAETSGAPSRAIIDSRPWIVLSAPLLRFTVPSACTPSNVTPVAGSYTGVPERFVPKYQLAATAAIRFRPGAPAPAPATASADCSRESAP